MPSNNSGIQVGYLAGKYPGRLGWLISPKGWRNPPDFMPTALDNGAFGAWIKGESFDYKLWLKHIETAHRECKPLWLVIPDVVTNKNETLKEWNVWSDKIRKMYPKTPLAIAVQDGMTPSDVPENADVIFVGGSTEWKWRNLRSWTEHFPRVHVARVNSERLLWMAHNAGAESCDGTGWFRGDKKQLAGLHRYLDESSKKQKIQLELNI